METFQQVFDLQGRIDDAFDNIQITLFSMQNEENADEYQRLSQLLLQQRAEFNRLRLEFERMGGVVYNFYDQAGPFLIFGGPMSFLTEMQQSQELSEEFLEPVRVGLTKEQLANLPRVTVNKKLQLKQTTCSICLDEYKSRQKLIKLDCEHCFHQKCGISWLKINKTCPVCRKEICDEQNDTTEIQSETEISGTIEN